MGRKRNAVAALAATSAAAAVLVGAAVSHNPSPTDFTNVAAANPRAAGLAPANVLSPELAEAPVAQGSTRLENPSGAVTYYGYFTNGPMVPAFGSAVEATKSEPDKNTYLVFDKTGLRGADPAYNYGTHFLFQGHENGSPGYITRINLDADGAHRVTLMATQDSSGRNLAPIDGSTWDPWTQTLLYTSEDPAQPSVYSQGANYPSPVEDLTGAFGRAGYEMIQNDDDGNVWLLEDVDGPFKAGTAKRPNSYVYRFLPRSPSNLRTGKLQALQVLAADGHPITVDTQNALSSADQVALHTYGKTFQTRWVTVRDTPVAGAPTFDANANARAANATPFKRTENGAFQPGSKFHDFYFDETGDTSPTSPENAIGGWGSIFHLSQHDPSADTGTLTLFYRGDQAHTSFDNVAFFEDDQLAAVEDAGRTIHEVRNGLDSAFMFDLDTDYGKPANQPVRFIAEGRDASATIDAGLPPNGSGNSDDNSLTGIHVSDGDTGKDGILGAHKPDLFSGKKAKKDGWRAFWTQVHGDNVTWELLGQ